MSHPPNHVTIGEKVALDNIEFALQKYWRETVKTDSDEAVLKASTLNLVLFMEDQTQVEELLSDIHEIISHHPGRIILIYLDPKSEEEIEAYISAYSQKSQEGSLQISAELIILKTGPSGAVHLAGAVLPLLLPDLPVYFWCTATKALVNPHFDILFHYTDRLILTTPNRYESTEEMAETFARILELDKRCKISDMSWSELTEWREAVAQFFDTAANQKYLGLLEEIEITYSGEKLSNHAFLMAGWLYSQLKHSPLHFSSTDDATIYFRRQSERLAIKIRKKKMDGQFGLYKIKLFAEQNEQSIIFTATARQNGDIETTVQKGGALSSSNYVTARSKNKVEMLCGELDFLQQDGIYLKACASIHEYLNES